MDRCLCPDFELRGSLFEIWTDSTTPSNRALVLNGVVVDMDSAFVPPLTDEELLSIYDYGKGY